MKPHYIYRDGRWVHDRPTQVRRVRAWLSEHGISLSEWCRDNSVSRHTVNDLLRGKQHGYYGAAHRAAIALGLKPDPDHKEKTA